VCKKLLLGSQVCSGERTLHLLRCSLVRLRSKNVQSRSSPVLLGANGPRYIDIFYSHMCFFDEKKYRKDLTMDTSLQVEKNSAWVVWGHLRI
jgi:hypothetical protein